MKSDVERGSRRTVKPLVSHQGLELGPGLGSYSRASEYLFGRADPFVTDERGGAVEQNPLRFVYGPSGVGKSTLLRVGLCPLLYETGRWLPIYVDLWGADDARTWAGTEEEPSCPGQGPCCRMTLEWRNAPPLPGGKSLWIFRYSQERRRIERYADQGPTSAM